MTTSTNEKKSQMKGVTSSATERALQSLYKGKRDVLPLALHPSLEREIELFKEGYLVAYHCIPDTGTHSALILYETYSYFAEVFHNVRHPILPRLIKKHFDPPWDSVASILPNFTNDHAAEWRRVGIACSASLVSQTEAPPHRTFASGYSASGAPKPECKRLLVELFKEYGCPEDDTAERIAKDFSQIGYGHFLCVGGSILQIFVSPTEAERYMYLTRSCGRIETHGKSVADQLMTGDVDSLQIRLICHPQLMLDPNKVKIFHYQSDPVRYEESKGLFREALSRYLATKRIGNEVKMWSYQIDAIPASKKSKRTGAFKKIDERKEKRARMNVTTRSMLTKF